MILLTKNCYASSSEFVEMINILGIPRYNVFGDELNEYIYNNYQEFIYGYPEMITSRQRWKKTESGKWSRNGEKGEYFILGRDYYGDIAYNFFFPVDRVPETTPDKWQYCIFDGAEQSWIDKAKYNYIEQINHMLNSKIYFDKIDFENNTTDPNCLIEYNITPLQIGKNKCKLDVLSTWKTYGSIITKRKINGIWWTAVFRIKPMSANAKLKSSINLDKEIYEMSSTQDEIKISLNATANVIDLEGYANQNHVKEINTKIYIDGKEVSEFSSSKALTNSRNINITINRKDLKEGNNIVEIVNKSYLRTEFAIDGLIKDLSKKTIQINVKKQKPKDPLQLKDTKKLIKEDDFKVENPFLYYDIPVFQAGQYIIVKLKFKDSIDKIVVDDGIRLEKIGENKYLLIKKIPLETVSSITSIKEAREQTGNYFNIKRSDLGNKINEEYGINFKYYYKDFEYKNKIQYEVYGDILNNFNYQTIFKNNINTILLNEWIKDEKR